MNRQVVKKRYEDKKEPIKQYKKEKYVENGTLNITYQKVRYQENAEVHLVYKNVNAMKIQRKSTKTNERRYQENPAYSSYQENPALHLEYRTRNKNFKYSKI